MKLTIFNVEQTVLPRENDQALEEQIRKQEEVHKVVEREQLIQ
jgi:hypothetical protein